MVKAIKQITPVWIKEGVKDIIGKRRQRQCEKAIKTDTGGQAWLTESQLDSLALNYKHQSNYFYDEASINARAVEKANELSNKIPGFNKAQHFLELGCYDGVVCSYLDENFKKSSVGIDMLDTGFSKRALDRGTRLLKMDAQAMSFEDNSFDVITSYDAFEHFPEPLRVLNEAYRVLKPGGYMYFDFGPLYPSPWGLHAYASVPVPYCQFLFTRETMEAYIRKNNKAEAPFDSVNGWSAKQFDQLWAGFNDKLDLISDKKARVYTGSELITKYPTCFKGKFDTIDSLFIASISILLKKK